MRDPFFPKHVRWKVRYWPNKLVNSPVKRGLSFYVELSYVTLVFNWEIKEWEGVLALLGSGETFRRVKMRVRTGA